jgi:adenylate kinase
MNGVITVFGVSGVGKGWLISRFAKDHEILHLQASQLLKDAKAAAAGIITTSEELRTGPVIDNQALLVAAFLAAREKASRPILFDGHCVIDGGAQLIEIPVAVIEALAPSGLIFVHDKPDAIFRRRAGDSTRVRPTRSADELHDHQERARAICAEYAELLKLDLHFIEAGDVAGFASAAAAIFRN